MADTTGEAPNWQRIDRLTSALDVVAPYATIKEAAAGIYAVMSWTNYAKGAGTLYDLFHARAVNADQRA